MGANVSHADRDAFLRMRKRINETEVRSLFQELERTNVPVPNEIDADDTIELALAKLVQMRGNVAIVRNKGDVIGVFDLFVVIDYLITKYRGALEKKEQNVVVREYDPFFFGGYEEYVERRLAIVPTLEAGEVLAAGAADFFSESVGEVLSKGGSGLAHIAPLSMAVDEHSVVSQILPILVRYNSCIVQAETGYRVLTELDVLQVLYNGVLRTNLQGLGDKKASKLMRKRLFFASEADRALLVLIKMKKYQVTAVPLINARTGKIRKEFSVRAVSAVHSTNFSILMGTVGSVLNGVDNFYKDDCKPVTASKKKTTLADVIELMHRNQRTHVWIVDKENVCIGVISLRDLVQIIANGVLAAENEGKVPKAKRINKTKSMKHFERLVEEN